MLSTSYIQQFVTVRRLLIIIVLGSPDYCTQFVVGEGSAEIYWRLSKTGERALQNTYK